MVAKHIHVTKGKQESSPLICLSSRSPSFSVSLSLSLFMSFTLVNHWSDLGCLHQPLKLGNGEVGYSNGPHKSTLNQFLHCLFNQEHQAQVEQEVTNMQDKRKPQTHSKSSSNSN